MSKPLSRDEVADVLDDVYTGSMASLSSLVGSASKDGEFRVEHHP